VLILAAYPGRAAAERAARALVRGRLLACATVAAGARAFYRWKGRERADPSALLWGKTTRARAVAAVRAIRAGHPDDVPEILILPILGGHAPYLAWLEAEVKRR
jgi:periplasmic divalent cation tolerance protein